MTDTDVTPTEAEGKDEIRTSIRMGDGPWMPFDAKAVERRIQGIEQRRRAGEAQADIEDGGHLGPHPDNVDREQRAASESAERLRSYITRIERLIEEKAALQSDIGDLFKSAKGDGYSVKAMRAVIKRRATDAAEADELDELVSLYRAQLGD